MARGAGFYYLPGSRAAYPELCGEIKAGRNTEWRGVHVDGPLAVSKVALRHLSLITAKYEGDPRSESSPVKAACSVLITAAPLLLADQF